MRIAGDPEPASSWQYQHPCSNVDVLCNQRAAVTFVWDFYWGGISASCPLFSWWLDAHPWRMGGYGAGQWLVGPQTTWLFCPTLGDKHTWGE
eukprot:7102977-Ditylum_brightwellii.AAC.1